MGKTRCGGVRFCTCNLGTENILIVLQHRQALAFRILGSSSDRRIGVVLVITSST